AQALGRALGILGSLLGSLLRHVLGTLAQITETLLVLTVHPRAVTLLPLEVEVAVAARGAFLLGKGPFEMEAPTPGSAIDTDAEPMPSKAAFPGAGVTLVAALVVRRLAYEVVAHAAVLLLKTIRCRDGDVAAIAAECDCGVAATDDADQIAPPP